MLVLSRKSDESIIIDGRIRVTVLGIRGNQVRLGIEAPPEVRVVREELVAVPAGGRVEAYAEPSPRGGLVLSAMGESSLGGPLSMVMERLHRTSPH